MKTDPNAPCEDIPLLKTLMPSYLPKEHECYVKLLQKAAYQDRCRNVALTGSYGSGKSSILSRFIEKAEKGGHKIAKISLISIKTSRGSQAPSTPAMDRGTDHTPEKAYKAESELTTYLEREILGQLIYQGEPSASRASVFNRVHDLTKQERLSKAVFLTLSLLVIPLLVRTLTNGVDETTFAWMSKLLEMPPSFLQAPLLLIAAVFWIAYTAAPHLPQKLSIGSVAAAGTALTLDTGSESYFNKYRDEIVYLFEANEFDTVVFEDIDRFNDKEIFLALKSLNFTLNNAPRIKARNRFNYVTFVYAVKDSLFETETSREDASVVEGSDRTKLFDMILSVVPFVSDFSAYDEARRLFEYELRDVDASTRDGRDFNELLRLASSHIADMRLMTSIRNDYLIMLHEMGPIEHEADKQKNTKHTGLGLTHTGILAMALYKNISPGEFERLRLGKGALNEIYDVFDAAIRRELAPLQEALATINNHVRGNISSSDVARALGRELASQIEKRSRDIARIKLGSSTYTVSGNDNTSIQSEEFWKTLAALSAEDTLEIICRNNSSSLTLKKDEFVALFTHDVPATAITELIRFGTTPAAQQTIERKIQRLQSADFKDGIELIPRVNNNGKDEPFDTLVCEKLRNELASELVLNGFIGKDFELYVSKYSNGARANAINFIAHYYKRNIADISFELDDADCREVLRAIPEAHLKRLGALNLDLLLYLLSEKDRIGAASVMISGCLENFNGVGKLLIAGTLSSLGVHTSQTMVLVGSVMERFDGAIDFFIGDYGDGLDDVERIELARIVFGNFNPERTYDGNLCKTWIEKHLSDIDFTACNHEREASDALARFFFFVWNCCPYAQRLRQLSSYAHRPVRKLFDQPCEPHNSPWQRLCALT